MLLHCGGFDDALDEAEAVLVVSTRDGWVDPADALVVAEGFFEDVASVFVCEGDVTLVDALAHGDCLRADDEFIYVDVFTRALVEKGFALDIPTRDDLPPRQLRSKQPCKSQYIRFAPETGVKPCCSIILVKRSQVCALPS